MTKNIILSSINPIFLQKFKDKKLGVSGQNFTQIATLPGPSTLKIFFSKILTFINQILQIPADLADILGKFRKTGSRF